MATLLPEGKQSFQNSAGVPLIGGKLYTYDTGTSTPRPTYQDAAGTTPNTNPIILDARGEATVFWSGSYKVVLKDTADVTIWTVDGVVSADSYANTTLATLAASGGSALVGYLPAGAGAVATTVQAALRKWVSVFDFMTAAQITDVQGNVGSIDCYAAFQAATNYVQLNPLGGVVYIPRGTYKISGGTITNDRSANSSVGRVSYCGEDENGTRLIYSGAGNNCFYIANNQTAALEQNASYQRFTDMTIIGPSKRALSAGITMNLGAWPIFERLNIQAFDFGVYLQDVDHLYMEKVNLRFNNKGGIAVKSGAPGVSSTQPNNFTLTSCSFSNNSDYAFVVNGGASINMFGGSVENNGTVGAGGFGLQFIDCGYEGGRGANIQGVYFEGNNGIADVILTATTINATPMLGVVHYLSCDFKRISNAVKTTNHILCAFGADATVGKQVLTMAGCSFKTYGAYAPSGATPVIGFSITPASASNFFDLGSYYMSATEKPSFIQNLNKKDLRVSKAANQTFANGVAAQWSIDTVIGAATNPLWNPIVTGGNIVIDETGTYAVSAFAVLSTSGAGNKYFTFLKNGAAIGSGESTSATNLITGNITARFVSGDVLTINYQQSTGANQDIAGSGSSQSNVNIVRLFG